MKRIILYAAIYLFALATSAQETKEAFDWSRPMLNKKAPTLIFSEWLTEQPNTKGKFIILDFWATYCGPCVQFTPQMNAFAKTFAKEAVFIAVATQSVEDIEKGIKQIQKVKQKEKEPYTPIEFYQATDPDYELFNSFQLESIPSVIIIDPKGIVRWQGNPHGEESEKGSALTEKVIRKIIDKYEN